MLRFFHTTFRVVGFKFLYLWEGQLEHVIFGNRIMISRRRYCFMNLGGIVESLELSRKSLQTDGFYGIGPIPCILKLHRGFADTFGAGGWGVLSLYLWLVP